MKVEIPIVGPVTFEGYHPSSGREIKLSVEKLQLTHKRLPAKGFLGPYKNVTEFEIERTRLRLYTPDVPDGFYYQLQGTITAKLKGDLFNLAKQLGLVLPSR